MIQLLNTFQNLLDKTRNLDFLGSLALRLYLAPVFWVAGTNKLSDIDSIAEWFGNPDWGLGLPFPEFLAWCATLTEVGGAILLVVGLAVRWISIPLMVTMVVAIASVHWHNGWQAVADLKSPFPPEDIDGTINRLSAAREILQTHGNYEWLTANGNFVISNNGVEWAATYLIMLLALFFIGSGRYFSVDYYLAKQFRQK